MKFQSFIVIILFIFILTSEEENYIIRLPNKEGLFKNIHTKKGPISYEFHIGSGEEFWASFPILEYTFEGIKENNNNISKTINMHYEYIEFDSKNNKICEMFYEYNYINKLIYAIGSEYKYFGGVPTDRILNFEKFTFNNKIENVTEIKIELNNGTMLIKNINYKYEISENEASLVSLPQEIFFLCYELFLKDYTKVEYIRSYMVSPDGNGTVVLDSYEIYKINNKQKKSFPNICLKIGNKTFLFNAYSAIKNDLLHITKSYNSFIFGRKFLERFDLREFDIMTGDINLYTNNIKPLIKINYEKNNSKEKKIKSQNLPFLANVIIIFMSISISISSVYFHRKYNKKIKIDYYNYYHNI